MTKVFDELVARNIRKLKTEYARNTVQNRINNLFYEAQQGYYDFSQDCGPSTPGLWYHRNHTATSATTLETTSCEPSISKVCETGGRNALQWALQSSFGDEYETSQRQ